MRVRLSAVILVVVVILAGCSTAPAPADSSTTTPNEPAPTTTTRTTTTTTTPPPTVTTTPPTMVDDLPDPPTDRLGWENGYWYNESINVDRTDGLNDTELDAVVARSMARVEYVRGLEFDRNVPVKVISREEFRNRTIGQSDNRTDAQKLHQEIKFEALFFVGEGDSAVRQREENTASNVLGYYSPRNDSIVIVSEDTESPQMNEITLSQELFHAVQESTFNVSNYTANTEETHNARDGIIEGDGNYVDHLYEERCDAGWDCLRPVDQSGDSGSDRDQPHVGMLALRLQPYSDGPVFVEKIYERRGWTGVNAIYDAPPESTEQTIHTEKYRVDSPTNVTIEDRSNDRWHVPDQGEGNIDYAQFGEAGVYVMLWYPSYEGAREGGDRDVIIPVGHFFGPSQSSGLDLYDYNHPLSAGWDGDKLLPYVTNDSATTNETGYVWKLNWDSRADAAAFEGAYLDLLEYHGAEEVQGRPDTYRIGNGEFADAFRVTQSGKNVTIVNAPTVDALSEVRKRA